MADLIELLIEPCVRDLSGLHVGRILPSSKRRMVGPFIFLDHMGPAQFAVGEGIDVPPHPHIGLATITYLFSGALMHRDTLGSAQVILPGDVNWMTAGEGIAHSERTVTEARNRAHDMHGLQSWVALPKEYEENPPEFYHHGKECLREFSVGDARLKLIAGEAYDHTAPVKTYSPLFYLEVKMSAGAQLTLPNAYRERALYLIDGQLRLGSTVIEHRTLPVFAHGETISIEAVIPSHFMLLGGDPLPEERFIWWNFVSTRRARIEQAKQDWKAGRFGAVPGDNEESVPLPE